MDPLRGGLWPFWRRLKELPFYLVTVDRRPFFQVVCNVAQRRPRPAACPPVVGRFYRRTGK